MKKVIYIVFTIATIYACSNDNMASVDAVIESGSLKEMQAKKSEVLTSYDSIGDILSRLEVAIAEKDTTKRYPLVTTFKVTDTVFKNFISLQGGVETKENILIYPEFQGVLTSVNVREGQHVKKGQVLAKIDDGGLSSQLAQQETQYQLAKTTFERQKRLWDQKIGSEMQLLQAQANMESLENSVEQLRSQLDKTIITAPFSGIIDNIVTEQGQVVGPGGQELMRIINLNNMYVKASVPENYLGTMIKGAEVALRFPAIGYNTQGKITNIGNFINPSNRTFEIEIAVPNDDRTIKPNLTAQLQINNYSNEDALIIPTNSIQENAQGDKYVYVISETNGERSKVAQTKIETGRSHQGFIEVLDGLKNEDVIVKDGALSLKDNATVTIQSTN